MFQPVTLSLLLCLLLHPMSNLQDLGGVALPRGLCPGSLLSQDLIDPNPAAPGIVAPASHGLAGWPSTPSLMTFSLLIPLLLLDVLLPGRMWCFGVCHLADFGLPGLLDVTDGVFADEPASFPGRSTSGLELDVVSSVLGLLD